MSKLEVLHPIGDWFRDRDDILYMGHGLSATPVSHYLYFVKMPKAMRHEYFGKSNRREFMEITFYPEDGKNKLAYSDSRRASRTLAAYDGLIGFVEAVETGRLIRKPTFLVAYTNPHMAQLADRVGFEIIREDADIPNEIVIAARYDDVREVLENFDFDRMERLREWVMGSTVDTEIPGDASL